jgi:hypothetical protein
MRRLFGILFLIVAPIVASAQPDWEAQFRAGNEAYEAGQYQNAIEAYRQVLDAGHASVALYHNLGNAYVRNGAMGPAIQSYAKGLRLAPGHRKLVHNLQQARERAGLSGPVPVLRSGSQQLADTLPTDFLAVLGWLAGAAGIGLAVYRTSSARPDAWCHARVLGLIAGGVLVWGLSLGVSSLQVPDRHAVVLPAEAPVQTAPADTAATAATVREGMLLDVERSRNGWTRIRVPDGPPGWVRTSSVGEV